MQVTQTALTRNPKSYSSWHHRKWIIQTHLVPLDAELRLVKQFMQADSRNFHCWSYWRLLVKLMGLSAEDQESYILGRIEDNFSNYSAWHERTRVLQALNTERPTLSLAELLAADSPAQSSSAAGNEPTDAVESQPLPGHVLQQEYELVKNAFYTEPHDQSSWLYLRWLIGNSLAGWEKAKGSPQEASATQAMQATFSDQASMCQEILDMEEQASGLDDRSGQKWPLLTLARLREVQHQLASPSDGNCSEAQQIYHKLVEIDPFRKGYYIDAMHGKAAQVTKSLTSPINVSS
ncbi:TPA: Rab geranylgeranyltransferase, variant 2 [Trebouxia sp. C0004]